MVYYVSSIYGQDVLEPFDHKFFTIDIPKGFKEYVTENTRMIGAVGELARIDFDPPFDGKKPAKTYMENWFITIKRTKPKSNYTVYDQYRGDSIGLSELYNAVTRTFESPYGDICCLSTYEASNVFRGQGYKEKMKKIRWYFQKTDSFYVVEFLYNSDALKNEKKTREIIFSIIRTFVIKRD